MAEKTREWKFIWSSSRGQTRTHTRNTEIAEGARTQVSEQYRETLQRRRGWRNKSETTPREHSPSRADHPPRTLLHNTQAPRPHHTPIKEVTQTTQNEERRTENNVRVRRSAFVVRQMNKNRRICNPWSRWLGDDIYYRGSYMLIGVRWRINCFLFFVRFDLFVRRGVVLWEWTHCWLDRVLRSGIMETGYERINLCRFVDKLRASNTNKHTRNLFSERTVFAFCWVHMSTSRGSFIKNNALKEFHCQLN